MPAWQLDKSPERSAVQLNLRRTVHEGLDSDGVESHRETNFFEACAVHKGKFLYFCHLRVGKVNIPEQVAIVTSVGSDDCKALRELVWLSL